MACYFAAGDTDVGIRPEKGVWNAYPSGHSDADSLRLQPYDRLTEGFGLADLKRVASLMVAVV